jgi:hypothetical protein
MTNVEAPYCDACGSDFKSSPPVLRHEVSWLGRIIAIGAGLLAALIVQLFRA